ncbi:MAG: helix-turn-helix domain-containing protein [Kofleriaceae bacterium]
MKRTTMLAKPQVEDSAEIVERSRDIVTLDIDPVTVVKTIAAGICLAGMQLIEAHQGRSLLPAKVGSDVLTADEVAAFLGLDRKTVYDYAGRGEIPCQRLGKRMLFSRTALVAWLSSCSKRSSGSDST